MTPSDQATLIERAARLRAMAGELRHDLEHTPQSFPRVFFEAMERARRWESEASEAEQQLRKVRGW